MPRSTAYEYFHMLESQSYVIKEQDGYRLSSHFLEWGGKTRKSLDIYGLSRPEIRVLADPTGEHTYLLIEENGHLVTLDVVKGQFRLSVGGYDGMHSTLNTTAGGKAILTELAEARVLEIIETHGLRDIRVNTIATEEALFEEIERVRRDGIAINSEERMQGVSAIATSITDSDGDVLGAIAVYGPTSNNESESRMETIHSELARQLTLTANVIEVNLGR